MRVPYLTLAANQFFWSRLRYDDNILCQLRVGEMVNAQKHLETTLELFWDLAHANNGIINESKYEFYLILFKLFSKFRFNQKHLLSMNNGIEQWEAIIQDLLNAIYLLTPPEAFLDPPYLYHHQHIYLQTKESALNLYFLAIQKFLELTVINKFIKF